MQQLKQTQNSVILRQTKKPQQFPLSAQTSLCVCLPVRRCQSHKHPPETADRRAAGSSGVNCWHKNCSTKKQGSEHTCRHSKKAQINIAVVFATMAKLARLGTLSISSFIM
ncbi:hypothetical protein AMECASPLE_003942 [Ameca splendens]|uniref:Uncharacterized protein n=1 Tax=Ameca splendens TaxID=208324 RepID=A0ABV0XYK1_9TELE